MHKKENNFAYIDGANLHRGVSSLGWTLDYARFRTWLTEKYGISRAYLFIGLVPRYKGIYTVLQEAGFTVVFKETTRDGDGNVKGNCDTELVLAAVRGYYEKEFHKATLVSSDGDYACLVDFLKGKSAFDVLLSPRDKCSFLLRKLNIPIVYLDTQRGKLEALQVQKEKAPGEDGTSQGSSSWL